MTERNLIPQESFLPTPERGKVIDVFFDIPDTLKKLKPLIQDPARRDELNAELISGYAFFVDIFRDREGFMDRNMFELKRLSRQKQRPPFMVGMGPLGRKMRKNDPEQMYFKEVSETEAYRLEMIGDPKGREIREITISSSVKPQSGERKVAEAKIQYEAGKPLSATYSEDGGKIQFQHVLMMPVFINTDDLGGLNQNQKAL